MHDRGRGAGSRRPRLADRPLTVGQVGVLVAQQVPNQLRRGLDSAWVMAAGEAGSRRAIEEANRPERELQFRRDLKAREQEQVPGIAKQVVVRWHG